MGIPLREKGHFGQTKGPKARFEVLKLCMGWFHFGVRSKVFFWNTLCGGSTLDMASLFSGPGVGVLYHHH